MAEKFLKTRRGKVVPERASNAGDGEVVLVGTYRDRQLAWIGKNGIYNYPVRDGDELTDEACGKVKELWLYASAKGTRHAFAAEFVGKMTREEFLAAYPTYAKLPTRTAATSKSPKDELSVLGKSENRAYYVFKTTPLDYGPTADGRLVVVRAVDFEKGRGRARLVKKAVEQFKADGEFAPLAAYLPSDLVQVPHEQLRVCESAVQMEFFGALFVQPQETPCSKPKSRYNVISMFSGAMGLDNGIERSGMDIRLCVEFQHAMAETIRANRPSMPLIEDDIRNYSGDDLLRVAGIKKGEEVFLVCGGPPCQAFSTAGKMLGFDDDRGNVFLKYIDLIGEIRPRYFLLENVRGLLSASYSPDETQTKSSVKGSALVYALSKIRSIGYSATFTLYDAANYGVPQKRERVIILGSRDGYRIPLIPPTHSRDGSNGLKKWVTFRTAVAGIEHCTAAPIPNKRLKYFHMLGPGQYWKDLPVTLQREAMGKSFDLPGGKTGFYRRLAWDEPSPTLVTSPTMPATDLMHPTEDRALSIEEYARIQMFPDDWIFKGRLAEIYKQIGNAVPVGMGCAAGKHILWFDSLSDEQKQTVQLVDRKATYSRYKNTSFEYFEKLMA